MEVKDFTYFYPERPALIHVDQLDRLEGKNYVAELKRDGSRLLLHRLPSGIWQLWNRHGSRFSWTINGQLVKELMEFPLEAGKYYLFDGEFRHNKVVGIKNKIELYDVLIFGNELLCGVPFEARRKILETLDRVNKGTALTIAEQFTGGFREVFDTYTQEPEIEGLVVKRLDGKLNLGRKRGIDSNWMLKVRRPSNRYRF